jgi:ATP-dependent HslUV protease ATP-binding subunit HslU
MGDGVQMVKEEMQHKVEKDAEKHAEEALLDLLLPGKKKKPKESSPVVGPVRTFSITPSNGNGGIMGTAIQLGIPNGEGNGEENAKEVLEVEAEEPMTEEEIREKDATREKFRKMLHEGKLEDKMVEITVNQNPQFPGLEMLGGGMEELESTLSGISGMFGGGRKKKRVTVGRAREILTAEEAEKLVDREKVTDEARRRVEQMGIVFIDEIDKIATKGERGGPDVSREGVQRDILPIVEGATVSSKWGPVNTDHILFIAAGAFNVSRPSDLIPELQGRFPLRVELESLGKDDFLRILTEPKNALTRQYRDLMATENVELEFTPESIEQLAILAAEVNSNLENIGARRLHTIMETLLDDLSFDAPDVAPTKIVVTPEYVHEKLADIVKDQDLGRYIL